MSWPPLPNQPVLAGNEVHVVRIGLAPPDVPGELRLLADEERSRADRLAFDTHRRRFIAARAALRRILAAYLESEPSGLAFCYSPQGRPALATTRVQTLDFNLAHSGDLALLALSAGAVGVDVEQLRPVPDAAQIAAHFFCVREIACLERLPPASRVQGFFRAWTRKEAILKASGVGLGALREVEVSLEPDRPPVVLSAPGTMVAWQLFHLEPGAEFVGALAVSGPDHRLRTWEWRWPGAAPGVSR